MNTLKIFLVALALYSFEAFTKECPVNTGKYGNNIQYQNMFCRILVNADKTGPDNYRNITVNDDGMIQIFSNFPGTTNSNSTGARVFYLFPNKIQKKMMASPEGFTLTHPSGVVFEFDKNGNLSSDEVKMKISKEINSRNKSGVEIESYSKGLVVDLGYRMGATPVTNKNSPVVITDKNNKKCSIINSDLNVITKDKVELIHKNNPALHKFLSYKCPGLDLSDLLAPLKDDLGKLSVPAMGKAPLINDKIIINDSGRIQKTNFNDMDALIKSVENKSKEK